MQTTRIAAVVVLIVGSGLALHVAQSQQPGIKRTDLQRHDLSVPGREVVQVRVDIAPGVASAEHSHPGEEIVYVIEGLLEYQVEGKPPVTLKTGDVLFISARTIHSAKNVGSRNGAELATYVVEKGKPLVMVKCAQARTLSTRSPGTHHRHPRRSVMAQEYKQLSSHRETPAFWRVTFDHPPSNPVHPHTTGLAPRLTSFDKPALAEAKRILNPTHSPTLTT